MRKIAYSTGEGRETRTGILQGNGVSMTGVDKDKKKPHVYNAYVHGESAKIPRHSKKTRKRVILPSRCEFFSEKMRLLL